jgi:glycosyltransferase involved in cell wall biosynthesis
MKVRHILPGNGVVPTNPESDGMSGIVSVAYHLAREQTRGGWETELVGLAKTGRPAVKAATLSPGLRSVPIHPWRRLRLGNYDFRYVAPLLFHLSLCPTADLHHVYCNPYLLSLGRAVKRVIHYQTPIGEVPPMYRRAVRRAGAVICCSEFIRGQFLGLLDYPARRVFVVHNGVDLERFKPGDRESVRVRLGLPVEGTIVLFAGQVNEAKGLLHLVRACRVLAEDHDFQLLVAGSSSLWEGAGMASTWMAYEEKVATEAAGINATFLGKIAYGVMPLVYQAADVFVCPSVWDEPFGMVALEAMACGLPVIASRTGGLPEFISDRVSGFLVPAADVEALASRVELLLGDRQLRERMGREGSKNAQRYGWETFTKEVHAVYQSVMER